MTLAFVLLACAFVLVSLAAWGFRCGWVREAKRPTIVPRKTGLLWESPN